MGCCNADLVVLAEMKVYATVVYSLKEDLTAQKHLVRTSALISWQQLVEYVRTRQKLIPPLSHLMGVLKDVTSVRHRGIFLAIAQCGADAKKPRQGQCRAMEKYALVTLPFFQGVGRDGGAAIPI